MPTYTIDTQEHRSWAQVLMLQEWLDRMGYPELEADYQFLTAPTIVTLNFTKPVNERKLKRDVRAVLDRLTAWDELTPSS